MSDLTEIRSSLGNIHDRITEVSESTIRIEERQKALSAGFEEHKVQDKEHYKEDAKEHARLSDGLEEVKTRATSLEHTRDKVKWTAKYVAIPLIAGSSGIAAKWDKIMKIIGMQ